MENKSNKILKVTGILLIIFGGIGIIMGIIAVVGALGLNLLSDGGTGMLVWASVAFLLSSTVSLIAGILGVKNCDKPEKVKTCITFGIITVMFTALGSVMTSVGGGKFNATALLTGLILPALYLFGAFQMKNSASTVQNESIAQ